MLSQIARQLRKKHLGHTIEVASYGDDLNFRHTILLEEEILSVSVECLDCHEFLIDAEKPDKDKT